MVKVDKCAIFSVLSLLNVLVSLYAQSNPSKLSVESCVRDERILACAFVERHWLIQFLRRPASYPAAADNCYPQLSR